MYRGAGAGATPTEGSSSTRAGLDSAVASTRQERALADITKHMEEDLKLLSNSSSNAHAHKAHGKKGKAPLNKKNPAAPEGSLLLSREKNDPSVATHPPLASAQSTGRAQRRKNDPQQQPPQQAHDQPQRRTQRNSKHLDFRMIR